MQKQDISFCQPITNAKISIYYSIRPVPVVAPVCHTRFDGMMLITGGKLSFKGIKEGYASMTTIIQAMLLLENIKKESSTSVNIPHSSISPENISLPIDSTRVVVNCLDNNPNAEYE